MFGYVIPDKLNMYIKDFNVYQSFYCGLCKTLGETGAQPTRLCTSYDLTFYNVLLHSLTNTEVKFEKKLCAYNGKKKVIIKTDDLSKKVADISVLMVYYNLDDDVRDGKKSRAIARDMLAPRRKKALKSVGDIDVLMQKSFDDLHKLECGNCDSIDRAADTFATLMRDMTKLLIKTDYNIDTFTYNLGRLVYLLDAVDDVEKDSKENTYNPLLLNYGKCTNKADYLAKNADELAFLLNSTYNKMVASYNDMEIKSYEGVLSNVVYLGIKMQLEKLLKGEDKCHLTRL